MNTKKILIIDNNPGLCTLVRLMLTRKGYKVSTALRGEEGLDMALKEKPDLIMLDINMPDLDGFSVGQCLREEKETRKIPIIVISGTADKNTILKAVAQLNAVSYVVKPFEMQVLQAEIDKVFEVPGGRKK